MTKTQTHSTHSQRSDLIGNLDRAYGWASEVAAHHEMHRNYVITQLKELSA